MTRIWRWMKRLKWAGYGNKAKQSSEVKAGELTIFCPACPQPGINIPENWKEDSARQVSSYLFFYTNLSLRWVYKRMLVADGNFKADHVRQQNAGGDIWLSEGSGMIPKRVEYLDFLKTAIERPTVSIGYLPITGRNLAYNYRSFSSLSNRRPLVKINFRQL